MLSLLEIFCNLLEENGLLYESIAPNEINRVIDNHIVVNITYDDTEPDAKTLKRTIYVYAYGLTKAGNPVIRAYQTFGDSKRGKPAWKLFRLDRIMSWQPTKQQFWKPINELDPSAPAYNESGDNSMESVYNQIDFAKKITKLK